MLKFDKQKLNLWSKHRDKSKYESATKIKDDTIPYKMDGAESSIPNVPKGAWLKCSFCQELLYREDVKENKYCCLKCNFHFRMSSNKRIGITVDEGSFIEWNKNMDTVNILDFPGYEEKLKALQVKTKSVEAVKTGEAKINGITIAIAALDSHFMMGSMGQTVGEKITYMIEQATKQKLPIVIFSASGGARMQEGIISLMQMAKTSAAIKKHSSAGLLYISVLTDPTTGGVMASFAMIGDIILAEPGAVIGFAGARVIEQTIRQKLPEGFQKSEFLLERGFIDRIVDRQNMRDELSKLLCMHKNSGRSEAIPVRKE